MTPLDLPTLVRQLLELVVLVLAFVVIAKSNDKADKTAAWAIIGLVVASIVRNLAGS